MWSRVGVVTRLGVVCRGVSIQAQREADMKKLEHEAWVALVRMEQEEERKRMEAQHGPT
eukprot:m.162326 g.162326  ORF g.162326 m.162326 type:complete len:59 (+) comp18064_c0_seq32:346-522(+)